MKILDEIPFTNEALNIYISEAEKEMERIKPFVSEFNKLKNRIKIAKERLKSRRS